MSDVVIASSAADAEAAERVVQHHAAMAGKVAALVGTLATATSGEDARAARNALVAWSREELMPHALAEEGTLYAAARQLPEARLLVEAMLAEHATIAALIDALESAPQPARAVAAAGALEAVLDVHLHKENELLLPVLMSSPDHSVADMLAGMHELLGHEGEAHDEPAASESGCGGACSCGEVDAAGFPELDARDVPHAIRHATIFGALDAVASGGGLVLVAPHDPLPLLAQLEQRAPGAFEVSYLERGPEAWRLQFVRAA
jgi:uncharacterized protein (DUF2249 family)